MYLCSSSPTDVISSLPLRVVDPSPPFVHVPVVPDEPLSLLSTHGAGRPHFLELYKISQYPHHIQMKTACCVDGPLSRGAYAWNSPAKRRLPVMGRSVCACSMSGSGGTSIATNVLPVSRHGFVFSLVIIIAACAWTCLRGGG